jgi:hypothetical protein
VIGSTLAVWTASDLVWLNVAAQVLNAFLMPLVIGFLVVLAKTALPEAVRLEGWRLRLIVGICAAVCALGVFGGLRGLM